jgi:hypothetical protein
LIFAAAPVLALKSKIIIIPDLPLSFYVKNKPNESAQAFGHMDRLRQEVRSTKKILHSISNPMLINEIISEHSIIYVKDNNILADWYDNIYDVLFRFFHNFI